MIQFDILALNSIHQYSHIDTSNSKIYPLVIIHQKIQRSQYLINLSSCQYPNDIAGIHGRPILYDIVKNSTLFFKYTLLEEESSSLCVGRYYQGTFTFILQTLYWLLRRNLSPQYLLTSEKLCNTDRHTNPITQ